MKSRFAFLLVGLALVSGYAFAGGYDSNGFEPTTFTVGALNGQDGWQAGNDSNGLVPSVVTSPDPTLGTQSIKLGVVDVQGANSWAEYDIDLTPYVNGGIVTVSFDLWHPDKLNQNLWWWWLDAGDPTYGLVWDIGGTRPFGFSGAEATTIKGQWVNVKQEWNFQTGKANSWYNGAPVDVNYTISGITALTGWVFFLSHDAGTGTGCDMVYIDNFKIDAVPEPSSIAALLTGAGALAGVVIRRKK